MTDVCAGCGKNPGLMPFRAEVAPGVAVVICPGRRGSKEPKPKCARRAAVETLHICRGCGENAWRGYGSDRGQWRGFCKTCETELGASKGYTAERHTFSIDSAFLYGATPRQVPHGVDARTLADLIAGAVNAGA